jgi:hypothetical protein
MSMVDTLCVSLMTPNSLIKGEFNVLSWRTHDSVPLQPKALFIKVMMMITGLYLYTL